jgi:hypothetical protein
MSDIKSALASYDRQEQPDPKTGERVIDEKDLAAFAPPRRGRPRKQPLQEKR